MSIKVLALDCTSDAGAGQPPIEDLLREALSEFADLGVEGELLIVANANIEADEGGAANGWPALRTKILGAQILLLGAPAAQAGKLGLADTILARVSSFAREADGNGHFPSYGKVAAVIASGPAAADASARTVSALIDAGFSVAANAAVSRAGQAEDDGADIQMLVRNTAHLAGLLRATSFPKQD